MVFKQLLCFLMRQENILGHTRFSALELVGVDFSFLVKLAKVPEYIQCLSAVSAFHLQYNVGDFPRSDPISAASEAIVALINVYLGSNIRKLSLDVQQINGTPVPLLFDSKSTELPNLEELAISNQEIVKFDQFNWLFGSPNLRILIMEECYLLRMLDIHERYTRIGIAWPFELRSGLWTSPNAHLDNCERFQVYHGFNRLDFLHKLRLGFTKLEKLCFKYKPRTKYSLYRRGRSHFYETADACRKLVDVFDGELPRESKRTVDVHGLIAFCQYEEYFKVQSQDILEAPQE